MIYPTVPYFPSEDVEFILNEFKNILEGKGFLTDSSWNRKLEEEFAKYIGTKYALTASNGTSALDLIYRGLDLKGKEVIITDNTFAATVNSLINAGGIPVFSDIGDDLQINVEDVENKITRNTKAVVAVHIGGFVSDNILDLATLCDLNELYLIEDSAQAVGSKDINGDFAGSFGIASGYSFFSTKVMTSGEGGIVTTNDEELYNRMKIIRDHGKEKKGIYQNWHNIWGYNFRLTEVQALMALTQLRRVEEFIKKREDIAKVYDKELSDFKAFEHSGRPNWYKWIGLCDEEKREGLYIKAKEQGVSMGGMVYEFPLHLLPCFKEYVRPYDDFPNAEEKCAQMFCPPIHTQMSKEDALKVCEVIKGIL